MQDILVANKEMVTPLHSLLGLDSFCLGFSFTVTTMYCLVFRFSFEILSIHYDTMLPPSWCARVSFLLLLDNC